MSARRVAAAMLGLVAAASCAERRAEPGAAPADRPVEIYAAVIRHMTSEEGQASGFRVIYVLDRIDPQAASPEPAPGEPTPIPQDDQAGITGAVAEVAPVEFITDRESVIGPFDKGGLVKDGGILITLGPIEGEGNRVEVPASSYLGNLAASWQTWVVERTGTGWAVTGTIGPVAIS